MSCIPHWAKLQHSSKTILTVAHFLQQGYAYANNAIPPNSTQSLGPYFLIVPLPLAIFFQTTTSDKLNTKDKASHVHSWRIYLLPWYILLCGYSRNLHIRWEIGVPLDWHWYVSWVPLTGYNSTLYTFCLFILMLFLLGYTYPWESKWGRSLRA